MNLDLEKAAWLTVIFVSLVGSFALAVWYARRQKACHDKPVTRSTNLNTAPQGFVPGQAYAGLPHAWTFANGDRVFTDAAINRFGPREVQLADGSIVKSSGDVRLRLVEREWSLVATGPHGPYVEIFKGSTVVSGDLEAC